MRKNQIKFFEKIHDLKMYLLVLLCLAGMGQTLNATPPQVYSFWVEQSNGNNGENFTTLSAAVQSINSRAYACNLYINEDCTLNEAITFTSTRNYAVTIYGNNHTITRGSGVIGDLITYSRTGAIPLIINDLTLDGANVSATGSLLKFSASVQLTLSNFTAINHTASTNGVCAVDASAAGAANYVQLNTAKIIGNTANGKPANLKIPGNNTYTRFNTSLTDDIGITTTNSGLNTEFARWLDANNTGWEHLKNDVLESNGTPYQAFYSATGRVRWISAENNFYVEGTDGANGESFSTLSTAVANINDRNYTCNLHIFEDCTLNEAITITSTRNRAVTIFGNGHTITRGSGATGNMITYERNSELKINNLTFDGANASATGALLYFTGTGALTVSDSEFKGSTTASTGSLISKSVPNNSGAVTFTNTVFNGNATTGDLLSFSQSSGTRTMNISFNNCTINGASGGNGNLVSHITNGTFEAINTTFTRNQSTGYGCYITSTGAVTFTDCTFDGSNTTTATQPLLKSGTGALTLTNTTVKNHTVSAANVCAGDASSAASVTITGSTKITGNTANSAHANLNIPSDASKTHIASTLTENIGITTTNYALESNFAVLDNLSYTGWENLKNDKLDDAATSYYVVPSASTSKSIRWTASKYYVEQSNGSNGQGFSTLSDAVTSINERNYACNLYIGEDCTLTQAIVFTNTYVNRAVTIYGNNHTITRGSGATGDLITYNRTAAFTINDLTLDGNTVGVTGSLLKTTTTATLTLNNVEAKQHTASIANVCAIDVFSASTVNLSGSTKITGNTANSACANLSIPSSAANTHITSTITETIGITTTNSAWETNFASWSGSYYSGWNNLTNDVLDNAGTGYFVARTATDGGYVYWTNPNNAATPNQVNSMFGNPSVTIALKTYPNETDMTAVPAGAEAGVNNNDNTNPYMVWKSATYNDDNSVDITLNYFQKQVALDLDFIFVIDESGTMDTPMTANGVTQSQSRWARYAAVRAAKCALDLNTTYSAYGVHNRVYLLSWDSGNRLESGFLDDYEQALQFASSYGNMGGGTDHTEALEYARQAALASVNEGRTPVVIYLSDFYTSFTEANVSAGTAALKALTDYIYQVLIFESYFNANGTYSDAANRMLNMMPRPYHYYMTDQNDPSTLITPMIQIVQDAVAKCGDGTTIDDVFANGVAEGADANSITSDNGSGDVSNEATYSSGTNTARWALRNDAAEDNRLNTGQMYTQIINIPMTDDVYSGAMPTNAGLTVEDDGIEVNRIDDSPILNKALTLVLKSANTSGAPLAGVNFTLTHGSNTWNLTTDANGQIVLPWGENDVVGATTAESAFAFNATQDYILTQNTILDGYLWPSGAWTLTVGSDYKITPSGATPAMEAHAGKLEIYNETVKIARVSVNGGNDWTYHEYLINSSGTGTAQGAFDYANTLSGNVVIETLLETAIIGSENRYALTEGFTFNGTGLTGLTLKTTDDAGYNSTEFTTTISRGDVFGSLITFNKASTTMIIQNLTLDGNNGSYTCNTNGGLVNVTNGTLSLADGATLQNSTVDASHNGGGVYLGSGGNLTVSGEVVVDNNMKETVLNNVYLNDATNQYVTIGGMQELKRCSHIGITKTSGYTNDSNDALHTVIAQGGGSEPANYCNRAFYNGCFFDDLDIYKVYCLRYGSEYATDKLYFIDSWEGHVSAAVAGTDYVLNSDYVTEVKTATGLAYFAKDVNSGKDYSGKTVTLSSDIDLSGHYWVPIGQIYSNGCLSYSGSAFSGTFDGQGKRINNMMSILPCASLGLFGEVDGGNITNTFVESGNLVGTRKDGAYMGGLVGYLHDGSITYSEAAVTMGQTTWQYIMGGLVGSATNSTSSSILIHSSMAMPVMNEGFYMGGLVGTLGNYHQGSIANCFVNAEMNKDSETYSVGGIVASHEEQAVFTNCYVRLQGNLPDPSTDRFGWLAGRPDGGTYSNCYIPEGKNQFGNGYSAKSVTHCGTYGPTTLVGGKYGFRHRDLQMTVADITDLSEYNDTPEGGLTAILNSWVDEQTATNGYARWSRSMASPINGDYPILMLPDFESAASLTGTEFIAYGEVNNLIQYANANTSTGGNVYLYSDIDDDGITITRNTESNVRLYIHEDIGVEQDNATINARVGVTIKNYRNDATDPNWHTFASALNNAPVGIVYHTDEDDDYKAFINQTSIPDSDFNNTVKMDPPKTTWNTNVGSIGYFPTNTPYGTWRETADPNGFFDFYAYSEPYYHWINLKREGSNTYMDHWHIDTDENDNHLRINYKEEATNSNQMINGKGYLVALSAESMMMSDGQLNNGNVTVALNKTDLGENTPVGKVGDDGSWRSFNLVGNPYQSYLNFDLLYELSANEGLIDNTFAIRDDNGKEYLFYTYEASANTGYTATNLIHPHQGFFVKVNNEKSVGSYNLTFTNDMRASGNLAKGHPFRSSHLNYPLVNLLCFDSHGYRDLTTIEVSRPELGGGQKMFKLVNGDARLYAHLEGGSYQTLFTPTGVNEVPVCFEAQNDGMFTLQWNTLHGDFYYLHLIDNITGADIDMLSTDKYQFEGRQSDYASRFKLVFHCTGVEEQYDNNNTGSETFAFISDGNIIVLTDARSASLQVIDMLGRILLTHQVTSDFRLPTSDFSPGVYVLRLVNGSDIKTQKLIINQ